MTNLFAVVGEHRRQPERLLLLGDDGRYYALTADGRPVEVQPSNVWRLDTDTAKRDPGAEPPPRPRHNAGSAGDATEPAPLTARSPAGGIIVAEEDATMATNVREQESGIHFATPEEGRALFDYQARKLVQMSGDEFLVRWDAGEFRDITDTPEHWPLMYLITLIPFARQEE